MQDSANAVKPAFYSEFISRSP